MRVIDVEALRCSDIQVMPSYAQVADDAFNLPAEYGMEFVGLFVSRYRVWLLQQNICLSMPVMASMRKDC